MAIRQVFQRIWNAMDWLAAVMAAGIYCLAKMWLEGLTGYALAMHAYVPDSNLSRNSPAGVDEKRAARDLNEDLDGM
jgi:hypothetical protein